MLTQDRLEHILEHIPQLTIGVVGDLFLDRYLDIDVALTEPSIETGLDAYQVVAVRSLPGAAGTVINNLVALGVERVHAVAVIGDDGEGYELLQALNRMRGVDATRVLVRADRRTPTYTKPMLREPGLPARELNRFDIHNWTSLPEDAEEHVLRAIDELWPRLDALLVLDQVRLENRGVVTARIRQRLVEVGGRHPEKLMLADSRERIGLFQNVWVKPNLRECDRATTSAVAPLESRETRESSAARLARRTGRPVFCTMGARGILVVDPRSEPVEEWLVPALNIAGPIDTVGAGDSVSAALAVALASGASLPEAAALGNLIASITIGQLGTTGTATPAQIRKCGTPYKRPFSSPAPHAEHRVRGVSLRGRRSNT
jgi:rfaE bifunctional protein kinase chain/domain